MKLNLIISIFVLSPCMLFAQGKIKEQPTAIFVIKSSPTSNEIITRSLIMPASSAQSFEIMTPEEVIKRFPNSRNLVGYSVILNPDVRLVPLKDFYKQKKLNIQTQKSLLVDGVPIADTSDALIETSSVTSVDSQSDEVRIETVSKDKLHKFKGGPN